MKPAVIFSIPRTTAASEYCWRWRSVDGKTDSVGDFGSHHDCLADAKANGYLVRLPVAQGENALDREPLPVSFR